MAALVTMLDVHAQDFQVSSIPSSLSADCDAVIRDHLLEVELINDSKYRVSETITVTVLNKAGLMHAALYHPLLGFDRLKHAAATIYDRNGDVVRKVNKEEFEQFKANRGSFLSEMEVLTYRPTTMPPFTIRYEIEEVSEFTLGLPSWYPHPGPDVNVERSRLVVKHPLSHPLRFKEEHVRPSTVEQSKKQIITEWNYISVKGSEVQWYGDCATVPLVRVAPSHFKLDGYAGNMATWEAFGQWINLLSEDRGELSKDAEHELDQLLEGLEGQEQKIRAIYQYLQNNSRYISIQLGIGGWQPEKASTVYEKGYGDCKGLTNLLKSMLEYAGIEARYCLISMGDDIDPTFPSQQFNHVVLCIPREQDTVWLESTFQKMPYNYLGRDLAGKWALVMDERGGHLVKTPTYGEGDNAFDEQVHHQLNADGSSTVVINSKVPNRNVDEFLFAELLVGNEREKWFQETRLNVPIDQLLYGIEVVPYSDFSHTLYKVQAEAGINCVKKVTNALWQFPVMLTRWPESIPELRNQLEQQSECKTLVVDAPISYKAAFQIAIPEGVEFKQIPEADVLITAFGVASLRANKISEREVSITYEVKIGEGVYDEDDWEYCERFFGFLEELERREVVVKKIF